MSYCRSKMVFCICLPEKYHQTIKSFSRTYRIRLNRSHIDKKPENVRETRKWVLFLHKSDCFDHVIHSGCLSVSERIKVDTSGLVVYRTQDTLRSFFCSLGTKIFIGDSFRTFQVNLLYSRQSRRKNNHRGWRRQNAKRPKFRRHEQKKNSLLIPA